MTKLEIVESIAAMLPSDLTLQERQHLGFYPGKGLLEAIDSALRDAGPKRAAAEPGRSRGTPGGTLSDKAGDIARLLRPHLRGYSETKAISELANTSHGVLDKLWEGL
jgi:hypothetical protein